MRIYIAGPYTPKSKDPHKAVKEAHSNVDRAIRVAIKLIEKGHYPFIPHLTHYIHVHPECKDLGSKFYYQYNLSFLQYWAEALFFIAPSKGANMEKDLAEKLGLPIYYRLDQVPDVATSQREDESDDSVY